MVGKAYTSKPETSFLADRIPLFFPLIQYISSTVKEEKNANLIDMEHMALRFTTMDADAVEKEGKGRKFFARPCSLLKKHER